MLGDLTMARRHGHAPLPPDSSFPRRPSHESFGKGHAPAQGLLATLLAAVKGVLQTHGVHHSTAERVVFIIAALLQAV